MCGCAISPNLNAKGFDPVLADQLRQPFWDHIRENVDWESQEWWDEYNKARKNHRASYLRKVRLEK